MKTFESGLMGLGLKIRLDTKGIHFIKPGLLGSSDDFYEYSDVPVTSSSSLVGVTTIIYGDEKYKGFTKLQALEIERLYALGMNGKIIELVDSVGIDGQEIEHTPEYKEAMDKFKAEYLQKKADEASKKATDALNAQAKAAIAAEAAAKAYDRHHDAANKAVHDAAVSAISGAVPPPIGNVAVYVAVGGQQQGPFDMAGLTTLVQQGTLTSNSMVWKEGLSAWTPAGQIAELASLFAAPQMPPVPPAIPPIG